MRVVVYGAGAVGGVVGARLFQAGHDVTLIARGDHYAAIRERGLRVDAGDESTVLPITVVGHPAEIDLDGAVVLLAMKTQDTARALAALAEAAPPDVPVVCLQNGVENERLALRTFEQVYGVCVMCPTGHLEPGVVQAFSTPITGLLDIGRYPSGVDDVARSVAEMLAGATFLAEARPDIMRWKYRKLISNLANAPQAICGTDAGFGELARRAMEEGESVLAVAGIEVVSVEEDVARRADHLTMRPAAGARWQGGSSWQSLARGTGAIESDFLNGEIVLLGRQVGVATPVNALLARVAGQVASEGRAPGAFTEGELLEMLS